MDVEQIFRNLKDQTKDVMHELSEMEDSLLLLKTRIENDDVSKQELLRTIEELRHKIGLLERIDSDEYKEEESASNIIEKLKSIIDLSI